MSQRGSVWPDACASAIQNLRLHLLHKTASSKNEGSTPQNPLRPAFIDTQSPSIQSLSTAHPISASTALLTQQPSHHAPCQKAAHQQTNVIQDTDQRMGPASGPSVVAGRGGTWVANPNCTSGMGTAPTISGETPINSGSIAPGIVPSDTNLGLLQWSDYMQSNNEINEILPLPMDNSADLFAGFDIPFWLGQDEYSWMVDEWS